MRQPSRAEASPPACRNGLMYPARVNPSGEETRNSPPQIVPSVPYPVPSNDTPMTVSVKSFSTMQESTCA